MKTVIVTLALSAAAACAQPPTAAPSPSAAMPEVKAAAKAAAPLEVPITSKSPEARDAFLKARELEEASRGTEAEALLKQAVQQDPEFAQAWARLAGYQSGKEAAELAAKARTLMGSLSEAEQLQVTVMIAGIEGKLAEEDAARRKLGELMPDDWRVVLMSAYHAWGERRMDEVVAKSKRALELNPKSGAAWNMLAYAYLQQGKIDDAVPAFKKYAEVAPTDPNAHDSLGDSLIRAGKLEEAEASFKKALEVDPKYVVSWTGVALTRALRSDWPAALEAMKRYVDTSPREQDKPGALAELASWQIAAGKMADADKSYMECEKLAEAQKRDSQLAFIPLSRAELLSLQGKHKPALAQVEEAQKRAATAVMTGGAQNHFKIMSLQRRLRAQAGLGAKDDAEKSYAELEAFIKTMPESAENTALLHEARGHRARAQGDLKTAVEELGQCDWLASMCLAEGVLVAEKAGDKAAADAMRAKLVDTPMRDGSYVMARSLARMFPAR